MGVKDLPFFRLPTMWVARLEPETEIRGGYNMSWLGQVWVDSKGRVGLEMFVDKD